MDPASFKHRSGRIETGDLDLAAFGAVSLSPAGLRCLRYMHDVEYHTICYLRDLLVTPAHRDPDITAFLTMWSYEEYWHGEAIADVLAAHGEQVGPARVAALRHRLPWWDRLGPLFEGVVSGVAGERFVALHMAWGAINEWTTQAAYDRLARSEQHPVLTELLGRVMRQEGRHVAFYASQAERRLGASRAARRLTRAVLGAFWRPVGAGVIPESEVGFLARHLFGDPAGFEAARRIDRRIDRLPGLAGLGMVERAVLQRTAAPVPASLGQRALGQHALCQRPNRRRSWPVAPAAAVTVPGGHLTR
jgi:hypothetical protein